MQHNTTPFGFRAKKFFFRDDIAGIVFSLPFIIGFFLFIIVPMAMSFGYSLSEYNILSPARYVGFKNYVKIFTDDPLFYKSIAVTFYYALVSVPLRLAFALMVAMVLKQTTKASGFYRAIYYLPSIIGGSVAVSILWKRMFSSDGVLNKLLSVIGIQTDFAWLGSEHTAIWVLIILSVWQFGSSMLIFLASLKQIPVSLYEASLVDGAGKWKQFTRITLPLLTPTIFFNLVMQMINGFLVFTQCYIITQGKPLNSTLFYMVYTYRQSFEYFNAGYAAALAWLMLIIIGMITGILFITKRFWVFEGEE